MLDEEYQKILIMIRAGALDQADKAYNNFDSTTAKNNEDILALPGRLKKSRAFETTGDARKAIAQEAAILYENAFKKTGGYYSGINTAAMYLIAGEMKKAKSIASKTITKVKQTYPTPGEEAYFTLATQAEAHLIIGDITKAKTDLKDAIELDPHNYVAHATTIRQFISLLNAIGADTEWLSLLRPPKILHYSGHMFEDLESNKASVYTIEHMIKDFMENHHIGEAFGSLAAGSDIIIAENLIEKEIDLHLVLPCPIELFEQKSLSPFGPKWRKRFDYCYKNATSVRYVSKDKSELDELTIALTGEMAMGLATLKANEFATKAVQLLVWDEKKSNKNFGTARDAKLWKQSKKEQHIIQFTSPSRNNSLLNTISSDKETRSLKAMIFADIKGFSKLTESQISIFIKHVLTPLSNITNANKQTISFINTWGDGIFLALDDIVDAAEISLELQTCFNAVNLEKYQLPDHLALRIGAHYGSIHMTQDPFLGKVGIFGTQISIASRIEPVTAPGSIFVSEVFACALAASPTTQLRCEYVSSLAISEQNDKMNLFLLRRKG